MDGNQVVGLGQVVLYGLQLRLAQAHLVLPPILLWVAPLVQDGPQHLMPRIPVQLILHACNSAACGQSGCPCASCKSSYHKLWNMHVATLYSP